MSMYHSSPLGGRQRARVGHDERVSGLATESRCMVKRREPGGSGPTPSPPSSLLVIPDEPVRQLRQEPWPGLARDVPGGRSLRGAGLGEQRAGPEFSCRGHSAGMEKFDLELAWFDCHSTEAVLQGPSVSLGLWADLAGRYLEEYLRWN